MDWAAMEAQKQWRRGMRRDRFRNFMAYIFWPAVIVLIALGLNFVPYLGGSL